MKNEGDASVIDAVSRFRASVEQAPQPGRGLNETGGGGTSGGVTDDWKASVDAQLKHLREDVQQVRNWIVVGLAGPLLAIVGLYAYNGSKFDRVDARFERIDERIAAIRVEQSAANAKLDLLLERTKPLGR